MHTEFLCLPCPAPSIGILAILKAYLRALSIQLLSVPPYLAFFAPPGCNSKGELVRYRIVLGAAERYRIKTWLYFGDNHCMSTFPKPFAAIS